MDCVLGHRKAKILEIPKILEKKHLKTIPKVFKTSFCEL